MRLQARKPGAGEAEVSEAAQKPVQARQKHNDAAAAESTTAQHEPATEQHAAAPRPGRGEQIAQVAQHIRAVASNTAKICRAWHHGTTCSQVVTKPQAQACKKCKLHGRDDSKCGWAARRGGRECSSSCSSTRGAARREQHGRSSSRQQGSTRAQFVCSDDRQRRKVCASCERFPISQDFTPLWKKGTVGTVPFFPLHFLSAPVGRSG